MNWKPILYEYARISNQRESDHTALFDAEFVTDQAYRERERKRQKRLQAWRKERGAKPLGSDAQLTIVRANESEREVVADIMMRKEVHIVTAGIRHTEEKIERERLKLLQTDTGEWVIYRIETIVPEKYTIGGLGNILGSAVVPSVPYINERVLSRTSRDGWERPYYNREAAVEYAHRHWNEPNADFHHFDVDCTNYVSQCVYAGGLPMNYTGKRETGWWYKGRSGGRELWSYSWSVAHALNWYLAKGPAETVSSPRELTIGDVISYDFDGDGRFQHSTIVTGIDGSGMPLVNAHTTNSKSRFWDYQDSYAWTERTQYRFLHIRDTL